jgi:hypothetical protein
MLVISTLLLRISSKDARATPLFVVIFRSLVMAHKIQKSFILPLIARDEQCVIKFKFRMTRQNKTSCFQNKLHPLTFSHKKATNAIF